jgi:hypothetical protein
MLRKKRFFQNPPTVTLELDGRSYTLREGDTFLVDADITVKINIKRIDA